MRADTPLVRATYRVVYSFKGSGDGESPQPEAAPLALKNGLLYGTTSEGGGAGCFSLGCGTVFQVTPLGSETVIYRFKGQPDGAFPSGSLINFNGLWYGMTSNGGANGYGAVFAVDNSGYEHIVYSFKGGLDGSLPFGRLIAYKGTLYGTTVNGGKTRLGTVFSVTPSGNETVLHTFRFHSDGAHPYAGLTALNGNLYGATIGGGTYNAGTVFSISTSGKERVVYNFQYGTDGAAPQAPLICIAGKLYGTTTDGGGQGYLGTVFEVSPSGAERVLHRFQNSINDGVSPQSALLDVNGTLYGTTDLGGRNYDGVVFALSKSGVERVLHNFKGGPRGKYPTGGLTVINGTLYGTTSNGGTGPCYGGQGCGSVFALTP
jgi:uncharacterized repeat protein (TIGR03803 family)